MSPLADSRRVPVRLSFGISCQTLLSPAAGQDLPLRHGLGSSVRSSWTLSASPAVRLLSSLADALSLSLSGLSACSPVSEID